MVFKRNNALAGIDMIIAVFSVIVFSVIILTLISNNVLENVKTTKETMAMIYMTEIFEKIGIADYDAVLEENKDSFVTEEILNNYEVEMEVTDTFENIEEKNEPILKKIKLTLKYEIGNKTYSCSMQRLKIKE